MKITKKIICIIAVISLVVAVTPLNFSPFKVTASAQSSSMALTRPRAGISVTEVTRVAYATNTMKPPSGNNSVIVKATPSGIPYLSGYYSSKIYCGETPQATQIRFTPGVELSEAPVLTCNNSTVQFSNYDLSNGTYSWTVSSGTATVGTTLIFTVSYSYSEENTLTGKTYTRNYQTQAISYVESILVPAGIYSTRRTYENFVVGSSNKNRSYIASFLLGKNVYGGIYNNGTGDGCIDFSSTSWYSANNWTSEYGNMLNFSESGSSRAYNVAFEADSSRPLSYVYFDTSMNFTLSDINLRFCTLLPSQASEVDERVKVSLKGVFPSDGIVNTFADDSTEDEPSFDVDAKRELGIGTFTGLIEGIGATFTLPFSGDGPPLSTSSKDYTVAVKYQTAAQWTGIYVGHSFSLRILTYDKGKLRELVEQIQNTDPVSVSVNIGSNEFKGYNPQSWYYSSGYEAFLTAFNAAKTCLAKPDTNQSDINTAYDNLVSAYGNLKLAKADYSAAEIYYNRACEKNQSDYTASSWARLQAAINNYRDDYSVLYQPAIDKMVVDISTALKGLEYQKANYSDVFIQLSRVNELIGNALFEYGDTAENIYVNWSSLASVLKKAGCIYDELDGYIINNYLAINQQSTVDGYALLIKNAVDALYLKKADYTYASGAESAYLVLKLPYIIDDIAEELTEKYNTLISLHNLDISYQQEIDSAADELYYWLDMVQYKPADTTAARKLIAYARTIDKEQYSDFSLVEKAIDNLSSRLNLDIRYQSEIDRYTSALQSAIDNVIENAADYTLVDEAIQNVNRIANSISETYADSYGFTASDFYSNWADVENAVNNVVRQLDISKQSVVDSYADAINAAVARLTENPADYSELTSLIPNAENILRNSSISSKYTSESVSALLNAYTSVTLNLKISSQSVVDKQTENLRNALDGLVYVRANYANVNLKISEANEKIAQNDEYNELHLGYNYFTPESLSELNVVLASVTDGLDITQQAIVDGYAVAIQNAINNLEYGPADYSQVDLAVASVPEDLSVYTELSVATINNSINSINLNLMANDQQTVDNYAVKITNAISKLKYKIADYSLAVAAIETANQKIATNYYTEESVENLLAKIGALVNNLDIFHQSEVDEQTENIVKATNDLVLKSADYTELQKILDLLDNSSSEIYNNRYSNFDEVVSAISEYREKTVSQNMNLTIDHQDFVDEMTFVLLGYINSLVPAVIFEPKADSSAVISEINGVNYVYGLDSCLTEEELVECFDCTNVSVEFEYSENQTQSLIGTSTVITVKSTVSNEIVGTYIVLIYGDVNGDGEYNAMDSICISCVNAGMLGKSSIGNALYMAADCDHNGKIDEDDIILLNDASLYGQKIDQQTNPLVS